MVSVYYVHNCHEFLDNFVVVHFQLLPDIVCVYYLIMRFHSFRIEYLHISTTIFLKSYLLKIVC